MKRTATTLVLLAGFGGGCVSPESQANKQPQRPGGFGTVTRPKEVPGVQGPGGEPLVAMRGPTPGGVRPAGATTLVGSNGYVRPVSGDGPNVVTTAEGCTNCAVPGVGGNVIRDSGPGYGYGAMGPYGPHSNKGIVPVPTMGPPGAVAYVGPMGPGAAARQGLPNGRTSINFTGPAGMKVTWQLPDGTFNDEATALTAPKEYNFLQGSVYRLRLTSILPDFPGKSFYPTLEIAPANPKSLVFLSHSSVPLTFTAEDFAQAKAGNLVVKVVYLPDPINQTFNTVLNAEEVVSTKLEPGADPVAEAQRMGTILAIVRMGNIDLENRVSPSMTSVPGGGMLPPGAIPPGAVPVMPGGPGAPALPPGVPALPKKSDAPALPKKSDMPPGAASVRPPAALPDLPPASVNLPLAPLPPASGASIAAPIDLPALPVAPIGPGAKPPVK
ncbi:hypothetical protein GobsT_02940 [Gemmata obscuriglobus]|uniref:Uncharacterized protein n=1 Tax=Gemmata obscuriglobus TaxID=114 RepID=A0A2Z3HC14_9BACT|nr:hypothetical protein [Gemmata obscuriglobus]AWM41097.1 hypothetical protein C1280_31680 [Gemmata obscuriglobus]QEG25567.1 hypothetical protein GobsT_02940 [Gemmata obscuriglobus]VTR98971.1 Uncharacterized protein OS=Singulisphaera acidiphila (strain ATCC BAA-1392 / DSM 18658 / VKM B-2454 / MOB10) GN=Sinac_4858 PE=4 SV=1 [Gemmata obscuriglobus UQM 2246]